MKDEIIEQVWLSKDAIGQKYNYDVRAMGRELQQRERASKAVIVNLHDRRQRV